MHEAIHHGCFVSFVPLQCDLLEIYIVAQMARIGRAPFVAGILFLRLRHLQGNWVIHCHF